MSKGAFNFFKFLLSRVVFLYLAAFGITYFFLDHKGAQLDSYGATLSRLQPPYDHLTKYIDEKVPYDRKEIQAYRLFFSQLVKILPGRADGHAMLGFCQYELGDTDAALASFKKAADAVPPFMWFNYAAGYIYFQNKDYPHAIEYLSKAILSNDEFIFKFIKASKPYLDAIATMPDFQKEFLARTRAGLRDSYKLLVLSYFYSRSFEPMVVVTQKALQQNLDDDGFFLYYLGVGAYHADQFEASVSYLEQSAQKDPDSAETYYYLSLDLKAMGQEALAIGAMQKGKELESSKGTSFTGLKNIRLRIL